MRLALAVLALGLGITMANAQTRFPVIQPEAMNAEQKKLFETIISGPRAQNYGGEAAKRVWLVSNGSTVARTFQVVPGSVAS